MKQMNFKCLLLGALLFTGLEFTACKSKKNTNDATTTTTTTDTNTAVSPEPAPAPVQISQDDSLKMGVRDATKDYPGVNADVNNGEITLTGNISRDKLPRLMQSLHSLHPKKVNNNLKIK